MSEMLSSSVFFGVMISILAYEFGVLLKKKTKLAICNPLLIAIVAVIVLLALLDVDYASYKSSANLLSYLLTPATVCLAIPLLYISFDSFLHFRRFFRLTVALLDDIIMLVGLCPICDNVPTHFLHQFWLNTAKEVIKKWML